MVPIAPMLLGRVEKPFTRPGWISELKFDGFRAIVDVAKDGVRVWSKQGREMTRQFPELRGLRDVFRKPVLLDGELCVLDENGHPRFDLMRSREHQHSLVSFDLLRSGKGLLIDAPWEDRRAQLERVIVAQTPLLLLSRAFADGVALFEECERRNIEGIVLKRIDAPYRSGRTRHWLKCKTSYGKRVTRERMAF